MILVLCVGPILSFVLSGVSGMPAGSRPPLANAYYTLPAFEVQQTALMPLSTLNWDVLDQVLFYCVAPLASVPDDTARPFVQAAHDHGKLAGITVGGINSSTTLSGLVATAQNRTLFADNLISMLETYGFDSLEFDWVIDTVLSNDDVSNMTLFLQLLRQLKPSIRLGFTLGWTPARADIANMAQYLDWGNLLAFYFWSPFNATTSGAVSPTVDCASESQNGPTGASVQGLISQWLASGFPASKMLLGFAPTAYNYTRFPTTSSNSNTSLFQSGTLDMGNPLAITSTSVLIRSGVLNSNAKDGVGNYQRYWDSCSQTPYLISVVDQTLVSYEDPESISAKVSIAKEAGLSGVTLYGAADDAPGMVLLQKARDTLSSGHNGLGRGFIALWVMIPVIVLSLLGIVAWNLVSLRRKRPREALQSQTPPSPSLGDMSSFDNDEQEMSEKDVAA